MNTVKVLQTISFRNLVTQQKYNLTKNETIVFITSYKSKLNNNILEEYLSLLPENIQHGINKYRKWEDKYNALFGKLLVYSGYYYLTGEVLDFNKYMRDSNGKPYIKNIDIEFNISHTDKKVVCAFNKDKIGIDIEQIQRINYKEFRAVFSKEEFQILEKGDVCKFYEFWTQKESISKAMGKGMYFPLREINILKNNYRYDGVLYRSYNYYWDDSFCTVSSNCKNTSIKWILVIF